MTTSFLFSGKNKDDFEEIKSGIATLSQKLDTFWTSLPNVEGQFSRTKHLAC